ncbi:MAG: hypothetical protein ACSHX5_05445 [Phycisphaerales bacterium]
MIRTELAIMLDCHAVIHSGVRSGRLSKNAVFKASIRVFPYVFGVGECPKYGVALNQGGESADFRVLSSIFSTPMGCQLGWDWYLPSDFEKCPSNKGFKHDHQIQTCQRCHRSGLRFFLHLLVWMGGNEIDKQHAA